MTVLFSGIGLVAAGFAVIVARQIAGGIVVDQLVDDRKRQAGGAKRPGRSRTSLMTSIATTVIVIGVLFARRRLARLADRLGARRPGASSRRPCATTSPTSTPAWRSSSASTSSPRPTQGLRSFLTTLVVAGMAAFGIHELRKQTAEEFPDAELQRRLRRHPDRVVGAVKGANLGERAAKLRLPKCAGPSADDGEADAEAPDRGAPAERRGRPPAAPRAARPRCARRASSPTRSSPPRSPALLGGDDAAA